MRGADAVTGHHADGDGLQLGEIGHFLVGLHPLNAGEIAADKLCQLFLCSLDLLFLKLSRCHDVTS